MTSESASSLPRRLLHRFLPSFRAAEAVRRIERALVDGDGTTAREAALVAVREWPDDPEPAYLLGRAYAALGDQHQEAEAYEAALRKDGRFDRASAANLRLKAKRHRPLMEAWRLHETGLIAEARTAFAAAAASLGPGPDRQSLLGEAARGGAWCALALGRADEAAAGFEASVGFDPFVASAWLGLGMARFRLGAFAAADHALLEALKLKAGYSDALSFLGWSAYAQGDLATAERRFGEAEKAQPLDPDPRFGRAWCAVRRGDPAGATTLFAEAALRGADHPSVPDLWALAASDSRYADAAAAVRRRLPPPSTTMPTDLPDPGAVRRAALVEALAALRRGEAAIVPVVLDAFRDAEALLLRGRAMADLGRTEDAVALFDEAAAAKPGWPFAPLAAAEALVRAGRAEEANRRLRPLLDRNFDDADVFQAAADAAAAAGDLRAAAALRAAASKIDGSPPLPSSTSSAERPLRS